MTLDNEATEPLEEEIEPESADPNVQLMHEPFNPSLINIENKLLNIDLLIKRIGQKVPEIELNTENYFQRKGDLWDVEKQSRLIESILIRFPLPAFYFDGSDKNRWLVVDGLQRLSSIRNFAVTKTLRLTNLEFLTNLEGKGFDDLDRDLQRHIEETQIVAYIINPGTPDDVKFNIFKRINTGGLILVPQEIRHALNQGIPARFIAELADMDEFKNATGNAIKTDRMLDRDFANRFLSFYLFGYQNYTPDLDTFMSRAMAEVKNLSEDWRAQCKEDFRSSMNLNLQVFGKHAFRKIFSVPHKKNPLNKALFDVFSVLFARLGEREAKQLVDHKDEINDRLIELIAFDYDFWTSITAATSDRSRVYYRFEKIGDLINLVLGKQDDQAS